MAPYQQAAQRILSFLPALSSSCKKWIGFGLFMRLFLIPWTGHSDPTVLFGSAFLLLNNGVLDIYQYLAEYFSDPGAVVFSYEPLFYFVFGLWSGVTQIFADPEYSIWMRHIIDHFPSLLRDEEVPFSYPGAEVKFQVLFLWKILYLICDFLLLLFILKIIAGDKEKESYISWWAGSVVLLYSQYMFGQWGIVPMTLVVIGIYLYKVKRSALWMGLFFSLSVPFKLFTLVLLPLPFLLAKGWKEKLKTACWILVPLLVAYIPFVLHSGNLVLLRLTVSVEAAHSLLTWGWVLVLSKGLKVIGFISVFYHAGFRHRGNFEDVLRYVFICFLLLLCVPLKIHYYAWITPFWFLYFHEHRKYVGIYGVIVLLLFFANLSDKQTFIGIFAPLAPDFFMSFPGWMDITYFFSPSAFHAKFATLIIFILSALVVVHQFSILFDFSFRKDALKKPDSIPVRKDRMIFAYPVVCVVVPVLLFAFAHPAMKTLFKDYFFIRSSNFYYEKQLKQLELPSGASLVQEVALKKGRVKKTGIFLDQPIDSTMRIELLDIKDGEEKLVFMNDHLRFEKGWVESFPQSYLTRNKKIYYRLTNTSPNSITISVRRRPKFGDGFQLTQVSRNMSEEKINDGVLRIYVQEEPLFLHDSSLPFRSIKQAIIQEKSFLIFWFAVLAVCGILTLRYRSRSRSD